MADLTASELPERGSFAKRLNSAGATGLFINVIAAAALWLAIVDVNPVLPAIAWIAALFAIGWSTYARTLDGVKRKRIKPVGVYVFARTLLLFAVICDIRFSDSPLLQLPLAAIVTTLVETQISRILHGAIPFASAVPGLHLRAKPDFPVSIIYVINFLALSSAGLSAVLPIGSRVLFSVLSGLLAISALLLSAWLVIDAILRVRSRRKADTKIHQLLDAYAPEFAIHWDAAAGTEYQLGMWLPFLERLQLPFIVIIRNQDTFEAVSELTDRPVLLRKRLEDLDRVVTPTLKLVFYVNNAVKNAHMVRYTNLRHIQLNHGDSDKAPSYNPVSRMYDRNFVAGRAAIDRFTNNRIQIHEDFFRIVGRPQVEEIALQTSNALPRHKILYAPTWAGFNEDSRYSSVENGPKIVKALIENDCDVIYRPHPYTDRTPELKHASHEIRHLLEQDAAINGRSHIWGDQAEHQLSIVDCFNQSTAMIADVSSVVPDYLYSEKPFAICAVHAPLEEFVSEVPLTAAGYVIEPALSNLLEVIEKLTSQDSHLPQRKELKGYFLGDFDRTAYSQVFVDTALEEIAIARQRQTTEPI